MAAVAASDAPQATNSAADGTVVDERKQRLEKLQEASSHKDVEQFVGAETNEDMKRMLNATVGRLSTPLHKQKVDREKFQTYLKEKQVHEKDCWNFPFVIAYFVMFAIVVLFHEDIPNVSQVERLMRGMMEGTGFEGMPVSGHKSMGDIDLVVDIWTFLKDATVPWFIPSLSATQPRDINRVMRYNQLIGGVQLQQIRRKKVPCTDQYPDLGPKTPGTDTNPLLAGFACYPWDSASSDCFGAAGCINATGVCAGWCPDPRVKTASTTSRRLEEKEDVRQGSSAMTSLRLLEDQDAWENSWLGLGGAYWGDIGRRLASPTHASKVKGRAREILSSGPDGFEGGVYTVTLHEHQGLDEAIRHVKELQAKEWLDTGSSWFGLKVFVLNPDLAVFTHMIVNVFFAPSGQLLPEVSIQSFPAEPYQATSTMGADAVWALLWFHMAATNFISLMLACGRGHAKQYLSDFWNWLNWLTILGGFMIMILWLVFLGRLQTVKDMAMNVVLSRPTPGASPPFTSAAQEVEYLKATDELHSEVAKLSGFLMLSRLLICWYTIIIMFRFFQAFKAQPRLAVVTNTITRSLTDLAHFIVVLMVVLVAYAVAAMFLFGHRLLQFSELGFSLNTCFLIMIGDFDFAELGAEHPLTAVLWFWSYMILVALIMLNMLLAIIMDVYTEVKMDASEQDPIWTQFRKVLTDAWSHRDYIKLKLVIDTVHNLPMKITQLDKDLLLEMLPDMREGQAMALIQETMENEQSEENKGMSISDAMKMVGWIKIAVQKVARRIEDILLIEKEEKEILLTANTTGTTKGVGGRAMVANTASFDPVSDQKMQTIEGRLGQMETFLNESMVFSVYRAKEMRNRLNVIEDLLQGQANVLSGVNVGASALPDEWDAPPGFAAREEAATAPAITNFSA
jgi:hypothetical protein